MSDATVHTMTSEVPVFFPAGDEQLFGVLTPPTGTPRGTGVIVLVGGAHIPGTNRNRLYVRLAQELAARGFHVMRFDYHGVGESTGTVSHYDLERPFVEDLDGAVAVMRQLGLPRLVLIGSCFGSRTILALADGVPELVGAVLMSTPVGDFMMGDRMPLKVARRKSLAELVQMALRPKTLRSIFAPLASESRFGMQRIYKRTVILKARLMLQRIGRPSGDGNGATEYVSPLSEKFAGEFRHAVERGVALLFLYGRDDEFYREFSRARIGLLKFVFESARAAVDVRTVDGRLHGFTTLAVQDAAIEETVAWLERVVPGEDLA